MAIHFDFELTPSQKEALAATDPRWWFTRVEFANATSPIHPKIGRLELANDMKRDVVLSSVERLVPGKRVLDLFCANGSFSFEAARLGASEVLGVDYDELRIDCANFIAGIVEGLVPVVPRFAFHDIYRLGEVVDAPFDVTLALGGLYHLPDPALALRTMRAATKDGGMLVLQTSRIIRYPGSWAKFLTVERAVDRMESERAGVWKLTPKAVETLLRYAGFEVLEVLKVPREKGRRIKWYSAVCRAV